MMSQVSSLTRCTKWMRMIDNDQIKKETHTILVNLWRVFKKKVKELLLQIKLDQSKDKDHYWVVWNPKKILNSKVLKNLMYPVSTTIMKRSRKKRNFPVDFSIREAVTKYNQFLKWKFINNLNLKTPKILNHFS